MNQKEAIEYITSVAWRGSRLGLSRIEELLERMDNPQKRLSFIHVAGTNGKGSTCSMLSHIFTEAGYCTGLFTSPYIHRFNERMQIDGVEISEEELVQITEDMKKHIEAMSDHPTEFEIVTALAMEYFYRNHCEMVVLEVGLGGRLDSTNVIPAPEAAVIANIGMDHVEQLGNTIKKIATEKAGIIKEGSQVVLYQQTEEVEELVQAVCAKKQVPLLITSKEELIEEPGEAFLQRFTYRGMQGLEITLLGEHQKKNAMLAIDTALLLQKQYPGITESVIRTGLRKTMWPGRFEILRKNPYVIVDGGHNPQCIESTKLALRQYFPNQKYLIVLGVMADKNYREMVVALSEEAKQMIAVTPNIARALPGDKLELVMQEYVKETAAFSDVVSGLDYAMQHAMSEDVICVVGSLYMTGDVRSYFREHS